jgi:hypothetical protein
MLEVYFGISFQALSLVFFSNMAEDMDVVKESNGLVVLIKDYSLI